MKMWFNQPKGNNIKEWCNGLIIEEIDKAKFYKDLEEALNEIEEYKDDWTAEDEPKFNHEKIVKPKETIKYWQIEESVNPRLPVGPTYGFLAESIDSYFYIESHLES